MPQDVIHSKPAFQLKVGHLQMCIYGYDPSTFLLLWPWSDNLDTWTWHVFCTWTPKNEVSRSRNTNRTDRQMRPNALPCHICRWKKCYYCYTIMFHNSPSLPSARQHSSYGDCLEVKREYYQNSSVLDCVTQCLQSAAHLYEQFLQVQQIGFVALGPLCCMYRRLPRVVLL